jgi:NAD-dependent dihydropyrimidine dehydrogenase PreA subunit
MINYWVDMVTGVAFVFCAVTGLMRLFPEATVSMSGAGQPVILGISMSVWQTVHDWSGAIMAAGVGVHTALHFRWLVATTGRMVRGGRGRERAHFRAPEAARPATTLAAVVIATPAREDAAAEHRYTRKGFLAAAGVFAAALVGGRSLARPTEVVIDAGACTGCRRCVLICPYGVFTMNGGKAVVQNGAACQLCAKCTRRCLPEAITLNP